MPITSQEPVSHVLIALNIDMTTMEARATFRRFVNGNAAGDVDLVAVGADLAALLGETVTQGLTRGDDVTAAIYAYAVAKGYIVGAIS